VVSIRCNSTTYVNGGLLQEIVLSSAVARDLAGNLFEAPPGYVEQSLMPQGGAFQ
jgi:hypothetical protein